MCLTTPSLSMTYVTRPGKRPKVLGTPYSLLMLPYSSLSRVKDRSCFMAKLLCDSTESELIPITSASSFPNSSKLSLKTQTSLVQPGESSFG
jgi:hypothetical protein